MEKRPSGARRGQRTDTQWVEPKIEADIAFTELTEDGMLRHVSFKGLKGMSVGFWFVAYDNDQPWEFFCDEESLTEAEWRQRAPADKVAELGDVRRGSSSELFRKHIAAS